ncbi:hypothetical protein N7486_009268 [Penicillium sp. IBT 16267x]|nr:hypothetical protein N7486_009268 [Penicillium sp. IBT 16267x]
MLSPFLFCHLRGGKVGLPTALPKSELMRELRGSSSRMLRYTACWGVRLKEVLAESECEEAWLKKAQ